MDIRSMDNPRVVVYTVVADGRNGRDEFYNVLRAQEGPNYLTLYHADGEINLLSARRYHQVTLLPQYDREAMQ